MRKLDSGSLRIRDIVFLILHTLLLSIVFGALLGVADYYLSLKLRFTFAGLMYWIIAYYIGHANRRYLEKPSWVLSLIVVLGLIVSYAILKTIPQLLTIGFTWGDWDVFLNPNVYLAGLWIAFNPLGHVGRSMFFYVLDMLIFAIGTFLGFQQTRIR